MRLRRGIYSYAALMVSAVSNWLLSGGTWSDSGVWDDGAVWEDS